MCVGLGEIRLEACVLKNLLQEVVAELVQEASCAVHPGHINFF